jgi:hypothetical protein
MEKWDTEQPNKAVLMRSLADSDKVQTVNLFSAVVDIGEIVCVNVLWMELAQDCVQ